MECILCAEDAQERRYFFHGKPLCTMHYAEYLEVLIESSDSTFGGDDASSAFNEYRLTLESVPLSEKERIEKAIKEKEKELYSESDDGLYTISR